MTNEEYSGRCRTCGSEVDVRPVSLDLTASDVGHPTSQERVCRNRACRTNNPRERRLTDIV